MSTVTRGPLLRSKGHKLVLQGRVVLSETCVVGLTNFELGGNMEHDLENTICFTCIEITDE